MSGRPALGLRDSVTKIVRGILERERPRPRVAEVYSYNRITRTAEVLLAGETDPQLQATFPKHMQPTRSKMDDGVGNAQGDIVLLEGYPNNYRITSIITGETYAEALWLPEVRAQASLIGGGAIDWSGRYLKWSMEFVAYIGMTQVTPTGTYEIPMPDETVTVQVHNDNSFVEDVIDSNGIDMNPGLNLIRSGLYWEPTPLADYGQPGTWHLVAQDTYFAVPASWIMIATMDLRGSGVMSLKLGTGELMDHWRAPSFSNSWVNYGAPFDTAAYRMEPGNRVQWRGVINSGGISSNICTFPEGYWPRAREIYLCAGSAKTTGAASAGTAHTHSITNGPVRVEAHPTGALAQQDSLAPSGYISLSQISYDAATV